MKKEIKNHFDIFKINSMWENRVLENRLLVSEQLEGVANIMEDMVKEIYIDPIFKEDVEEVILANLKNNKVDIKDVIVAELEGDNIEIYVEVDKAYKKENNKENIKKIISNTIGIPLKGNFTANEPMKERQRFKFIRVIDIMPNRVSSANYLMKYQGIIILWRRRNNYFVALGWNGVGKRQK